MSGMSEEALPEPDRAEGAPHPRETGQIFGQEAAEAEFLDAFASGRLHHGWLLTGAEGVGKATLAWRIARFLLANQTPAEDGLFGAPPPPASLDVDPEHPVARRLRALSEPGLFLLRRGPNDKGDRLAQEIRVSEVRKLANFFGLSAADGGRRVVIVDAADELNTQAANALLKMLEEPPARTVMLLVAHQPSRLLPTILKEARAAGATTVLITDLSASASAKAAEHVLRCRCQSPSPFNSFSAALTIINYLAWSVATAMGDASLKRYERIDWLVKRLDDVSTPQTPGGPV